MTVDVEDYFHVQAFAGVVARTDWERYPSRVERNTLRLLEMFACRQVRGTFFVLGWVARRFPGLVQAIRKAGHRVGCHGYAHRLIYEGNETDFRNDVRRARQTIEDITGTSVTSFARQVIRLLPKPFGLLKSSVRKDLNTIPVYFLSYTTTTVFLMPHGFLIINS
jgi:polysaccharide deacetylase family protein (PEP-CTERM system associated)